MLGFRSAASYLLAAVVVLTPAAPAAVLKAVDYTLSAPRVRGGLFDFAMTSTGEALAFIARDSGTWQLYRVRNLLEKTPPEDKLLLPGFFSKKNRRDLVGLDAHIYLTSDGKYAVCVASAQWANPLGGLGDTVRSDDVIATVDLAAFRVVATVHTEPLALFSSHQVLLDTQGEVGVTSLSTDSSRRGALVRLSIPDLKPGRRCSYRWTAKAEARSHPEVIDPDGCQAALGSLSLDRYLQSQLPSFSFPTVCEGSKAEFCSLPDVFTGAAAFSADGKYAVAEHIERHDSVIGPPVTSSFSYVVFSTAKRADIGEIKQPVSASLRRVLALVNGRDYLVVLENGTHLTAYELQD